ncbi:MAG: hypothetical protein KAG56_10260 [Sulfurovaceae bacterium]|nr:hypothetical protein [Sulfurovaceae bacterium]
MFGEFEEMVLYHSLLIKMMLGLVLIGMIIPFLGKLCGTTIKRMRIYMFVSHGLLSMIAFTGMIALVFAQIPLNLSMILMIVAFFALIAVAIIKYRKMLNTRIKKETCARDMRVLSIQYGVIEIAIIMSLVISKIMEYKSAVPTP